MLDRVIKILIVDDNKDIKSLYGEFIANSQTFEVRTATSCAQACEQISNFKPELVVADVDKFTDQEKFVHATKAANAILIWASRFETLDFEDLPVIARILNKPFRPMDVKIAIRSELNKANRPAHIKIT